MNDQMDMELVEPDLDECCDRHIGVEVKFLPDTGCPLCELEKSNQLLRRRLAGESVNVLVTLDERNIPPIVDDLIDTLKQIAAETGSLAEQVSLLKSTIKLQGAQKDDGVPRDEDGNPLCPDCGKPMVERHNTKTGGSFYGCTGFREGCRGTREINPVAKTYAESDGDEINL